MKYKDFAEKLKNYIRHNLLLLIKKNLHAQHNIKPKSMLQKTWMITETKLNNL